MTISAATVKELRDKTGAGMMDCKAALTESAGDMEAAIHWLRAKGLAKAAKKAGRVAAEGLIGIAAKGPAGAIVEVNSETDFVARNDRFQTMVAAIADAALASDGGLDAVAAAPFRGTGHTVDAEIKEAIATIGENMTLRRSARLEVRVGVVASYVHSQVAPDLGKIGVLVGMESTGDAGRLMEIGRQVAMHVAAAHPLATRVEDLDPQVVARERAVFADQARQSGKPEAIIDKMVDGRMRKFYEESVLLAQAFVINPELTVEAAVKAAEPNVGAPITVTSFVAFRLGEGVERDDGDFAAEVAAAARG